MLFYLLTQQLYTLPTKLALVAGILFYLLTQQIYPLTIVPALVGGILFYLPPIPALLAAIGIIVCGD